MGRYPNADSSKLSGSNYIKFGGYRGQSSALPIHVLFVRYVVPFPNKRRLQSKIKAKFRFTAVKISGG